MHAHYVGYDENEAAKLSEVRVGCYGDAAESATDKKVRQKHLSKKTDGKIARSDIKLHWVTIDL